MSDNTFQSLGDYIAEHGSKKKHIAAKLGISRYILDGLLFEDGHQPPEEIFDVRSDLADRVAALTGQTADEVRDYYRRRVAA
jgi:hypothetical protein